MTGDTIWGKYAPKPPKMAVNKQFQAQTPQFKIRNIPAKLKPIMTPFCANIEG